MFLKKRTPVRRSGWPSNDKPMPMVAVALAPVTAPAKTRDCLSCAMPHPFQGAYCPACQRMLDAHKYRCERCGDRPAEKAVAFDGEWEQFVCSFCARVLTTHA